MEFLDLDRKQLIEQLRADNEATREEIENRLAALEADPIAMSDYLAQQHDDFIAKISSDNIIYKDNADALVANISNGASRPHLVDFESGDRILKQRIKALEQKVAELRGQVTALLTLQSNK